MACLVALILAGRVTAQTFTTLHGFLATSSRNYTNSDGAYPIGGLISSGDSLYGTTSEGGRSGNGTVFALNTNGGGVAVLHHFTSTSSSPYYANSDGANPYGRLVLSGDVLYGTAGNGGGSGNGTVFAVHTNGTGFTNLHSFTAIDFNYANSDGAWPQSGLVLSGDTLYGTAEYGGRSGHGTVFALSTKGTGFVVLHSFTATDFNYANNDGAFPVAGLILSGNTLYGTTSEGGSSGNGTAFRVNTNGTGFTNLHSFTGGNKGAYPLAGLVLSGNTLYGTTSANAANHLSKGTVFKVNTDGTGFTNLHTFTFSEGTNLYMGLILSSNTLYGTTQSGGPSGNGTVFALQTDGTGFTNLYHFTATSAWNYTNSDGANPNDLWLSGNTLYGTAYTGGRSGNGTVFGLSIVSQPELTIIASGPYVILTWLASYSGFTLQSTTNLGASTAWTHVSPEPVTIGDENVVIDVISGTGKFYRLSQ
jgi:uncharacterized repeat protein (TIGR03803 family)